MLMSTVTLSRPEAGKNWKDKRMFKVFKSKLSMQRKKQLTGLVFTLPALIGVIWLFISPMIRSLYMSFSSVAFDIAAGKAVSTLIGARNYVAALTEDPNFNYYLVTSLTQMATTVPIIVFFSFFASTLVNQKFRGRSIARFMFFLPLVISSATVLTLDSTDVFQRVMADANYKSIDSATGFLQSLEIGTLIQYTGLPESISLFIQNAIGSVFKTISLSGVQIIILLAALQSVPKSLYEMAIVEGATAWEIFWKITFVLISPMLLLCTLYSVIDSFISYDNLVLLAVNNQMYKVGNIGLASAMAWIYFAVVAVILGIIALLGSKLVFYYDK